MGGILETDTFGIRGLPRWHTRGWESKNTKNVADARKALVFLHGFALVTGSLTANIASDAACTTSPDSALRALGGDVPFRSHLKAQRSGHWKGMFRSVHTSWLPTEGT